MSRAVAFVVVVFVSGLTARLWAQAVEPPLIDARTTQAVQTGLTWLATRQQPDGTFGTSAYRRNPAVVSFCATALLSSGSTPGRGPYGVHLQRSIEQIISCAQPDGYLIDPEANYYHAPMYGHGFGTLFLGEVYGLSPRDEVGDVLRRAVKLIVATQNAEGGWRYAPEPKEADVSVTACMATALRSARNAGISVPKETIDHCIEYLKRCQTVDGGFRYRSLEAAESAFPRSAAAVVALSACGVTDGETLENGRRYCADYLTGVAFRRDPEHLFYGCYYAAGAAKFAGNEQWRRHFPLIRDRLLERQTREGYWVDDAVGKEYATALALIVLQLPGEALPIFQR